MTVQGRSGHVIAPHREVTGTAEHGHSRFDRVATWVTEEPQASLPLRLLSPATRLQRIKSEAGSRVGDATDAR
jgi:hypothetical protein